MRLTITLHCDTIQGRTDCTATNEVPLIAGEPAPSVDAAARANGWDIRPIGVPNGPDELKAWCPDCKEILFGLAVKAMSDQLREDVTETSPRDVNG